MPSKQTLNIDALTFEELLEQRETLDLAIGRTSPMRSRPSNGSSLKSNNMSHARLGNQRIYGRGER